MGLPIRIETRTGDTPASKRQRQRRDPPHILLTTPEQLALVLASPDAPYLFGSVKRVVLDELHALVTSKRGDLLALGLARLFALAPDLTSVGLSATVAAPDGLRRFLVPQTEEGGHWLISSWRRAARPPMSPCLPVPSGCRGRGTPPTTP
jgi:ATP-dependent helicase Lhr and Lhr-like helicase